MYGVEVHANALQNMLDGEYVRPMGTANEAPSAACSSGAVVGGGGLLAGHGAGAGWRRCSRS